MQCIDHGAFLQKPGSLQKLENCSPYMCNISLFFFQLLFTIHMHRSEEEVSQIVKSCNKHKVRFVSLFVYKFINNAFLFPFSTSSTICHVFGVLFELNCMDWLMTRKFLVQVADTVSSRV